MRRQKDNKRRNQNQDNFLKPKRACQFTAAGVEEIDYKDVKLLRRFVNDQGKIMPRRITGTSAKMHRKLVRAIKRSRSIALMPYVENNLDYIKRETLTHKLHHVKQLAYGIDISFDDVSSRLSIKKHI